MHFKASEDSGHSYIDTSGQGRSVQMVSLDSWREREGVRNIQAIKLDIEGWELWALQGGERLLREERPVLVCEVYDGMTTRSGYQREHLLSYLEGLDYVVKSLPGTWSPTLVAKPI